ncbi:HAD family hydrolase [Mucilaginibacter koreensis]
MLSKYKNIIWDFDGVILDSMPIRDSGFSAIFEGYPAEQVEQLLAYHKSNGGISRFAKIRYFYQEILKQDITDEKVNDYAAAFSKIMKQRLTNKDLLIAESVAFIKSSYQKYNFHVVSASEQSELRYLIEYLNLQPYFKSVHGSPVPKIENVKKVIEENHYNRAETCLIGDSGNDHEASEINGIHFFGYNNLKLVDRGQGYLHNFDFAV